MITASIDAARQNLFGGLWIVAFMAAFSVEDLFLKLASGATAVSQVLIVFGAFGMGFFSSLCPGKRQSFVVRDLWHPSVVLRFSLELFGRLFSRYR